MDDNRLSDRGFQVGKHLYYKDTDLGVITRDEVRPVSWSATPQRVLSVGRSTWFRYPPDLGDWEIRTNDQVDAPSGATAERK